MTHLRILAAAGLALAASACATAPTTDAQLARTPADQFPFKVSTESDETLLAVHASGVSANQAAAVTEAAARWRQTSGEPIVLHVPAGGAQEAAATAMAEQVRSVLMGAGLSYATVRIERYDASAKPTAPLVMDFPRYRAEIPRCGETWENLTGTQSNNVQSNFGCAISANMAAQVANPRDLIQARAADNADGARAAYQMDQYRQGQDTASTAKNDGGKVSTAVN